MDRKNYIKNNLIFFLIFLLIGFSATSSLGGYSIQTNTQLLIKEPLGVPLNNGYIDAYWKFDECNGDILEDSSGHDYDGTIYGASWTTGYSGCALEFDGTDDYVDLDIHSKDIGFNKTDDLIFSLRFWSTSSQGGIMYCLAGSKHVPEALIQLCSNGSILFKVWTTVCGIACFSNENRNDGVWHNLIIYVNGITAKPTIEIYIDGDLEGRVTKWLCEIENDDFRYGKIGRRAYENEGYFPGLIDEFKIIKYPDGNDQNPPEVSGPTSGYPGVEYDFTFVTYDPEDDQIELYIDWGNGDIWDWFGPFDSGEEVVIGYTYEEKGTYEIRAKSRDYWDDSYWSDPHKIKIGNAPPGIPTINGPTNGVIDVSYDYTIYAIDPDGDDVLYLIDWGDGTTSEWDGPHPSGQPIIISHSWSSPGTYNIKGKAKDEFGEEGDWSDIITVEILDNEKPTVPTISGPIRGNPGKTYTFTFTSSDSDGEDISYFIRWGDGTETNWSAYQPSGKSYSDSHQWDEKRVYTIEAKAKDINNAESEWGKFIISMPRFTKLQNTFLYRLFDDFSAIYLLFRQIIGLL